jgi:hypothetical protein
MGTLAQPRMAAHSHCMAAHRRGGTTHNSGTAGSAYRQGEEGGACRSKMSAGTRYARQNGHSATPPLLTNEGMTCGDKVADRWAPFGSYFPISKILETDFQRGKIDRNGIKIREHLWGRK